jgi:hypothetical protein
MINPYKLGFFILATLLSIVAFTVNLNDSEGFKWNLILFVMYVILVLVGLYDLGKDDISDNKDTEKKD